MTELSDLVDKLSARTLAVCRHYLPNGQRQGAYWVVGDVLNTPGRSMYVRLVSGGAGCKAGRWTDAATGQYGDLLDVIQQAVPSHTFTDALAEALAFVGQTSPSLRPRFRSELPRSGDRARQARKLFAQAVPLVGSLAEHYLVGRGINPQAATGLRYLDQCYCRPTMDSCVDAWPALIAPITAANGHLSAVHRIYLDPHGTVDDGLGKAPIGEPKRSLGRMQGNCVRFGEPQPLIVVAEGIENALSIRTAFPDLTVHAALTSGNLGAYEPLPSTLKLLIALDDDEAGRLAADRLSRRVRAFGITVAVLPPSTGDHNRDLLTLGLDRYRKHLAPLIER